MSESNWPPVYDKVLFTKSTWYAQSFTPHITHDLKYVSVKIATTPLIGQVIIALQYTKPDGTPTGTDLVTWFSHYPEFGKYGTPHKTIFRTYPPWRCIAGIKYALVIRYIPDSVSPTGWISYQPSPGSYTRGQLMKSTNSGSTWDTTDIGDLVFSEWGNPPLGLLPYDPTTTQFAVLEIGKEYYKTSTCITVSTSQPCFLTCHISEIEPRMLRFAVTRRGSRIQHFGTYSFVSARAFNQLQEGDTIYHTFRPTGLKAGTKYYYVFTGTDDWTKARSVSAIFTDIFPGGPGWTTTRRPNAWGDLCMITNEIGDPCPDHWKNVDESTPDEDETCVHASTVYTGWIYRDLYSIPDLEPPEHPIAQVHITARLKRQGGFAYVHLARIGLKVNGIEWWSSDINNIPLTYKNFHLHLYENPVTGLPWTYSEVNDLQLGIWLRSYRGIGWGAAGWCTQLYCKIIHQCSPYH